MLKSYDDDVFTPELMDLLESIGLKQIQASLSLGSTSECTLRTDVSTPACFPPSEPTDAGDVNVSFAALIAPQIAFDSPAESSISPSRQSLEGGETSCSTGNEVSPLERSGSTYLDIPTTLMIKNIPNRVSREQLVEEVMSRMPMGSFDFLYLPNDFKTRAGFGYAFINMASSEAVDLFLAEFNKKRLNCASGLYSKPIEVSAARVQGFTANVNRLISSPVLFSADEGSLPLIFNRDQIPIPFKPLMQLNRASVLFQTRPSIEELMSLVEAEYHLHNSFLPQLTIH